MSQPAKRGPVYPYEWLLTAYAGACCASVCWGVPAFDMWKLATLASLGNGFRPRL